MKNILVFLILAIGIYSCKTEAEKKKEQINTESSEIISKALAEITTENPNLNTDSILDVYTKIAQNNPNEGLNYAKNLKHAIKTNSITESGDTTKYFEITLVGREYYGSFANLTFELKNLTGDHVDKFWLKASLRDKKGEYLAGENHLMWSNVRPHKMSVEEVGWENININEIGEVILTPNIFEVEGTIWDIENRFVRIKKNKYNIKVTL